MSNQNSLPKVKWAIIILLSITAIGVIGFMYFEQDGFLDALYLTTITISTVGFGLPHELSDSGKVFTIFLIIFSFGNYAYAISVITTYLVEGQVRNALGIRKRFGGKYMKNHVIICGYGRNGRQVGKELGARQEHFVVIDTNADLSNTIDSDISLIQGDATDDEVLQQAGILEAKAIVSTMPDDADNLFVALSARALNPTINIVCRASSLSSEKKMHIAGVNHVVLPENVGGSHMALLVTRRDVVEFLDHLSVTGDSDTNLEVVNFDELPPEYKNKSIMEMSVRQLTGGNIVGFKTPEGDFIMNPSPNTKIVPDSKIFIIGTPQQIDKIRHKK